MKTENPSFLKLIATVSTIMPALPYLLFAGLLLTAVSACIGDTAEFVEAMPEAGVVAPGAVDLTPADQVDASALAAANRPADTVTPTLIPTFTPWPTASSTAAPMATWTPTRVIPTATLGPSPTPTKPPPLPTPSGVYSWTLKVPILMYHYISTPPRDADQYRRDLSVTPEEFERQMAYLTDNGYQTVDLYDLSLAITAKTELPAKPVIVTFDDGYLDNYENAFPILQKYGLKGMFFVVTNFIDEGRAGYLTWDMVKEMSGAGMRIEPHSKTHADLAGAERDFVIYEVLGSAETIAAHIGYTPRYFCYPSGRYDEQAMSIVQELDFWGAVTTADGSWHGFDDRFEWSRVRMRNTTTLQEFAGMVDPAGTVSGKYPEN